MIEIKKSNHTGKARCIIEKKIKEKIKKLNKNLINLFFIKKYSIFHIYLQLICCK